MGQSRSEDRSHTVTFEAIVAAIDSGGLLDVLAHPNPERYPDQRVLVVACEVYVYLVPFVEEDEHYLLKTIIPSRKATRDYLNKGEVDAQDRELRRRGALCV